MKIFRYLFITAAICIMASDPSAYAFKLGGKDMVRQGTGRRTMFIIGTIYYASLYVPKELKGKGAKEVINANKPMSVIMRIDTRLLTRKKFIKAVREGFVKAASTGYSTGKIKQFLALFNKLEMHKYDVIYLSYVPNRGIISSIKIASTKKTQTLGVTRGLKFKKALFAIWLGSKPVQKGLKKGMLGK